MMSPSQTILQDAVIDILAHMGPCTIDEVVRSLPAHGWSEVFSVVDEMSRDGRLVLRRPSNSNSGYQLSLSPCWRVGSTIHNRPAHVRFCVGCGYLCDEIEPEDGRAPWVEARHYLKKYGLTWNELDRTDDLCPACARVLACGTRRVPPRAVATVAR